MSRIEFIAQLTALLSDIPQSDRMDAITYYNSYFDEAGPENEPTIIEELGSPLEVARMIKADLRGESDGHQKYTENGFEDDRFQKKATPGFVQAESQNGTDNNANYNNYTNNEQPQRTDKTMTTILIVIAVVLTSPIWFSALATVASILFGVLCTVFGILLGLSLGGIGMIIGGIYATVMGLLGLSSGVPAGVLTIGGGLLCIAVGLLSFLLFLWIAIKGLPVLIHWIAGLCRSFSAWIKTKRKGGTVA